MFRGGTLNDYNILHFFMDASERNMRQKGQDFNVEDAVDNSAQKGHPRHYWVLYHLQHPKLSSVFQVVWCNHHNNLPNFIGSQFLCFNNPNAHELYCILMLMLLKPWRKVEKDLRDDAETWSQAFTNFKSLSSKEVLDTLAGIEYLQESHWGTEKNNGHVEPSPGDDEEFKGKDAEQRENIAIRHSDETSLMAIIQSQISVNKSAHAHLAIKLAKWGEIFLNSVCYDFSLLWTIITSLLLITPTWLLSTHPIWHTYCTFSQLNCGLSPYRLFLSWLLILTHYLWHLIPDWLILCTKPISI